MKRIFQVLAIVFSLQLWGIAEATTWYFGQGGGDSDANSCASAQTDSNGSRKATPQGALACVGYSAGAGANHIVEGRAGTYASGTIIGQGNTMPSGTSWGAPFTMRCRSGETCTIKGTSAQNMNPDADADLWVIIQGFVFDGTDLSGDQIFLGTCCVGPRYVRIIGNEFINTEMENAVYIGAYSHNYELINNHVHGGAFFTAANAAGRNHAYYIVASNGLVEGNELHDLNGYGVHVYCSGAPAGACSNNTVRKNKVYDFGKDTTTVTGIIAWPAGSDGGNLIYANKVYKALGKNSDGANCISITGVGSKVFNNTCDSMTWMGIEYGGSGHEIKNNIVYGIPSAGDQITGSGATPANNFCGQAHANCGPNGNPLFVNSGIDDYHLQSGSPAKDAGADLGAPYNVAYDGVSRPQGAGWDIGAYEFASGSVAVPRAVKAIMVD